MSKKILGAGIVMVLVAAVLVGGSAVASAQSMSLCQTVDALVLAGVIAPDKVAAAKAAAGCSVAAPAYTFTRNLTIGSTGADVTALQTKLGVTPATGYFGAITKAAVVAYQTANGIVPASGYVGPLTRAALNAVVVVPTTPVTPVTPTTPATTLEGGAGDITISTSTTNVEDTIVEGNTENVLSFKVEASDSDVAIKNLKVTLTNDDDASSYRIADYADSVDVYMGSKKVGSVDVADFTKSGHEYSKSIALTDAVVKEGSANKATFYVKVSAVSNVDSADLETNDWNLVVNNIRFTDATGAILTEDRTMEKNFAFSDLATSGDVKVTVSKGASSPIASNVEVSDTASTDGVLVLEFKVKATGSDISFDSVNFIATTTATSSPSDIVGQMVLKNGSDELATIDGSDLAAWNATSTFDLDDTFTVSEGSTETFRIYADINDADNYTNGDLTVKLTSSPNIINAEDDNGDNVNETGSAAGETQTFIINGAVVKYVSESFTAEDVANEVDGTINLKFSVEALGDNDVVIAEDASDLDYTLTGASEVDAIVTSTSEDAVDDEFTVTAGDTKTYTLSVKFATTTGFVRLTLDGVDGTSVSNVKTAAH